MAKFSVWIGLDNWLYFSYTMCMKTAVSIPDETFRKADDYAERAGLSRSELYAKALNAYLFDKDRKNLVSLINKACSNLDYESDPCFEAASRQTLLNSEWEA